MHRIKKGQYGYIKSQRKMEIIKTVSLFLLSLAIYLCGYWTTGTNKNLLTVVAILGCLPASKCAVNMIMFIRAKGCSEELYQKINPHDSTFEIPHMVFRGNNLVGIAVNPKCKTAACEKHLQNMCSQNNIKDVNIKIFQDIPKYLNRLDQLGELSCEDTQTEAVLALVKAISL